MIYNLIFLSFTVHAEFNDTCNALDEAQKCEEFCFGELRECLQICDGSGDMNCEPNCVRDSAGCNDRCPCNTNCPQGCPCETWDCGCQSNPINIEQYEKV